MKRVMIIGSGGAGKSTAAIALHKITGLPLIHLDHHYWNPGWTETPKEEWEKKIISLCEEEEWIMDGNYGGTMDYRLEAADTILFLYLPRLVCLQGALKRRILVRRVDEIPGCPEKLDFEFFKWIWNYNKTRVPGIMKKLEDLENKKIYIIRSRKQLRTLLAEIGENRKNHEINFLPVL